MKHIPKYGYYKDICRIYTEAEKKKYEELMETCTQCFIQKLKQEHDKGKIVNCAKFAPREGRKYKNFAFKLSKAMFPESKTP